MRRACIILFLALGAAAWGQYTITQNNQTITWGSTPGCLSYTAKGWAAVSLCDSKCVWGEGPKACQARLDMEPLRASSDRRYYPENTADTVWYDPEYYTVQWSEPTPDAICAGVNGKTGNCMAVLNSDNLPRWNDEAREPEKFNGAVGAFPWCDGFMKEQCVAKTGDWDSLMEDVGELQEAREQRDFMAREVMVLLKVENPEPSWTIETWAIKEPPYRESVAYYTRSGEVAKCGTVHISDKPVFAESERPNHMAAFNDIPTALYTVEQWCR